MVLVVEAAAAAGTLARADAALVASEPAGFVVRDAAVVLLVPAAPTEVEGAGAVVAAEGCKLFVATLVASAWISAAAAVVVATAAACATRRSVVLVVVAAVPVVVVVVLVFATEISVLAFFEGGGSCDLSVLAAVRSSLLSAVATVSLLELAVAVSLATPNTAGFAVGCSSWCFPCCPEPLFGSSLMLSK